MKRKKSIAALIILIVISSSAIAQHTKNEIKIVGEMKNIMWKGQLYGSINIDTIVNKEHLYGFGPVEYLSGELLIINGKSYKSTVLTSAEMKVEETFKTKAPFFAYANIEKWKEQNLPDTIQTIEQLETYLNQSTKTFKRPFMFKLVATIEKAAIHIVNLPKGSTVSSPEEAHNGQTNFILTNEEVDIIGFFSTEHKAIFTHHDSFLHMHLITVNRQKMGHLDELWLKKRTAKLYLPAE